MPEETPRPAGLCVEYADAPLATDTRPRFGWGFAPEHAAIEQDAYRIQVARADGGTGGDGFEGAAWDSGWIESDRSAGIAPDPDVAFEPGVRYRWRVGTGIDGEHAWSDPGWFETAPAEWDADWIAAPLFGERREFDRDPDPAPYLRTEFGLPGGDIERARAYVVGLGFNEFYCNGRKVGDAVLDPALTNYEERVLYTVHDLTDRVRAGEENAAGAFLGRGRYALTTESAWGWHEAPWQADRPALRALIRIEYADGRVETVTTGEGWRAIDSPVRFDSLYEGEVHDARVDRGDWTSPGYDDGDWRPVERVDGPGGDLRAQAVQPIEVVDEVLPETVDAVETEDGDRLHVLDMGEMIAGWVEVTVEGEAGDPVSVKHAERLDDDGRPELSQGHVDAELQRDVFVRSHDAEDTFEPRCGYKGFRYVEIEGLEEPPDSGDVTAKSVHSAVEEGWQSDFSCGNDLLDVIHENSRRAMLNNYFGIPTGCTVFEKNGWTGDAQLTAEAALYNFDTARFYRKWLDDIADAQRADGELPPIVPTTGWGYRDDDGMDGPHPGWDGAYVLIPWWLYQYCGDRRTLARHYEGMCAYVEYLGTAADEYIVDAGLGDWVPPGSDNKAEEMVPPEGPAITSTGYYARFAEVVADAAAVLDRPGDVERYRSLAGEITAAFNDAFRDASRGYYRTGEVEEYRQTSNVFPLAFGLVPDEHEDAVVESLVADVMGTHDGHLNTGIHGTKYLLSTLTAHGHVDVAYTIATQRDYPSWGHWIEDGATALYELWELNARSLDHHMFGSIEDWFYGHLAGIRPAEPGFETVLVDPSPPTDLDRAAATVDTHRGTVEAGWQRVEGGLDLDVAVPANTDAVVRVPADPGADVTVTGGGPSAANGGPARGYEIGAGDWQFRVR